MEGNTSDRLYVRESISKSFCASRCCSGEVRGSFAYIKGPMEALDVINYRTKGGRESSCGLGSYERINLGSTKKHM